MTENMRRIGAVLLAAGKSERFGGSKLLADFRGRPMVCCAMETLRGLGLARAVVVTGRDEIAALAAQRGLDVVRNHEPERGQAYSICLGIQALADMDAALLLVGDQPLLTLKSLRALLEAFASGGRGIACLRDGTHMGNPAIFSRAYFPALLALSGDRGAKGILRAHEDDLTVVRCAGENELADCDTAQELLRMIETADEQPIA